MSDVAASRGDVAPPARALLVREPSKLPPEMTTATPEMMTAAPEMTTAAPHFPIAAPGLSVTQPEVPLSRLRLSHRPPAMTIAGQGQSKALAALRDMSARTQT